MLLFHLLLFFEVLLCQEGGGCPSGADPKAVIFKVDATLCMARVEVRGH